MFCLLAGYAMAHPQAPGWAGIWQNGMWTSPDDDMDNIPGSYPPYCAIVAMYHMAGIGGGR